MAISHLQFNRGTYHGNLLAQGLALETAREQLIKARDCMQTMINGDGSAIAHFDEVVKRFGVEGWSISDAITDPMRTTAKGIWDELNSALSKITTDSSVSSVQSALLQLFNKLR